MAVLAALPVIGSFFSTAAAGATAATGFTGAQLLTGASTALSAAGAVYSGISGMQAANYQAATAGINAQIARDNAKMARERSFDAQLEQDTLTMGQLGEQEAIQSASGLGGRSQMLTRKASLELGRQDALRIRRSGEMDAYNYENQARSFDAEASLAKSKGSQSLLTGFLGAGKSIIDGASAINNPNRFNAMQQKGRA